MTAERQSWLRYLHDHYVAPPIGQWLIPVLLGGVAVLLWTFFPARSEIDCTWKPGAEEPTAQVRVRPYYWFTSGTPQGEVTLVLLDDAGERELDAAQLDDGRAELSAAGAPGDARVRIEFRGSRSFRAVALASATPPRPVAAGSAVAKNDPAVEQGSNHPPNQQASSVAGNTKMNETNEPAAPNVDSILLDPLPVEPPRRGTKIDPSQSEVILSFHALEPAGAGRYNLTVRVKSNLTGVEAAGAVRWEGGGVNNREVGATVSGGQATLRGLEFAEGESELQFRFVPKPGSALPEVKSEPLLLTFPRRSLQEEIP